MFKHKKTECDIYEKCEEILYKVNMNHNGWVKFALTVVHSQNTNIRFFFILVSISDSGILFFHRFASSLTSL